MRTIIIITAALTLAACGSEEAANEVVQADEIAFEDEEQAGDITAIDAATDNDSGMAADSAPTRERTERAPTPQVSAPTEPTPMDEALETGAETAVEEL